LAGDALLTHAFETIACAPTASDLALAAVRALSCAAGARGMVGGQVMDMAAETVRPDLCTLRRLQSLKTGALITAAAELGCIAAGITEGEKLEAARTYAAAIGRAFQITDDILDAYGSTEALGKATGRDEKDGKTTYLTFMTREEAYAIAREESERAKRAIAPYEGNEILSDLADYLLDRNH
jgi:geranylgeranyl pyrophosphate synthase